MKPHLTVSLVPPGYWAVALVLGCGFVKLTVLKIEVGLCWQDHGPVGQLLQ